VEGSFSPTEQGEKHALCRGYLCTVDPGIVGSISFAINIHCVDGNMAKKKTSGVSIFDDKLLSFYRSIVAAVCDEVAVV